jgi:hypothetical protein
MALNFAFCHQKFGISFNFLETKGNEMKTITCFLNLGSAALKSKYSFDCKKTNVLDWSANERLKNINAHHTTKVFVDLRKLVF